VVVDRDKKKKQEGKREFSSPAGGKWPAGIRNEKDEKNQHWRWPSANERKGGASVSKKKG